MLFIGLTISVSADEIVGTWILDREVSLEKAKIEDEKWFLKDAKAKDVIFDTFNHEMKKHIQGYNALSDVFSVENTPA
jgi:hypothetical protein